MRPWALAGVVLTGLVLAACEPVAPQDAFTARRNESGGPKAAATVDEKVDGAADPTADIGDEPSGEASTKLSPAETLQALTGQSKEASEKALAAEPPASSSSVVLPAAPPGPYAFVPAPLARPAWTPGTPLEGSFGVRLVSTLPGTVPPRAILGMPDGTEQVVRAGDLVPAVGVAVLAVGRDVVQIARITPDGDRARVDTAFLPALFPAGTAPSPLVGGN